MRQILYAGMLLAAVVTTAGAQEHASENDAIAMVRKVATAMKAGGVDRTLADINAFSPEYRDRDLYVSVIDMKGNVLAHGANKRLQRVNIMNLKDIDERLYVKERLEILKSKDSGWQEYKTVNYSTGKLEPKRMYFQKYQNIVINCGVYHN